MEIITTLCLEKHCSNYFNQDAYPDELKWKVTNSITINIFWNINCSSLNASYLHLKCRRQSVCENILNDSLKAFEALKHRSTRCLGNFSHHQIQFKNKQTAHEKGCKPVNYQIRGFSNTFNASIRDPNRFDFVWSVGLLSDFYLRNCFLAVLLSPPFTKGSKKGEEKEKTNRKDRFHKIQYRFQSKRNKICVLLVADQLQIFSKSLQTADSSNISFYNNWIKLEGIMVNRTASQKDL